MRIVGGDLRGRRLAQPKNQSIRPTTDRNREALFNIIAHGWPEKLAGSHILDVFAGTGALGFEALSRGGDYCVFIEPSKQGNELIRSNIETFKLAGRTKVLRKDATKPAVRDEKGPFHLIFADPPYGKGLGERAVAILRDGGWFADDALLVLEEEKNKVPDNLPGFSKRDERKFGDTSIGFFQFDAP